MRRDDVLLDDDGHWMGGLGDITAAEKSCKVKPKHGHLYSVVDSNVVVAVLLALDTTEKL